MICLKTILIFFVGVAFADPPKPQVVANRDMIETCWTIFSARTQPVDDGAATPRIVGHQDLYNACWRSFPSINQLGNESFADINKEELINEYLSNPSQFYIIPGNIESKITHDSVLKNEVSNHRKALEALITSQQAEGNHEATLEGSQNNAAPFRQLMIQLTRVPLFALPFGAPIYAFKKLGPISSKSPHLLFNKTGSFDQGEVITIKNGWNFKTIPKTQ